MRRRVRAGQPLSKALKQVREDIARGATGQPKGCVHSHGDILYTRASFTAGLAG